MNEFDKKKKKKEILTKNAFLAIHEGYEESDHGRKTCT